MKEINLTEVQKIEYIQQHKSCKDKKQADRIKSILLFNDGYSLQAVSKILLVDENTLDLLHN